MAGPSRIWTLAVDTQNGYLYAGPGSDGVHCSMDHGETWEIVNNGLANRDVRILAVNSKSQVFAVTPSGFFRSNDYGLNWHALPSSPGAVTAFFLYDNSKEIWVGTEKNGIYVSEDDGESWKQILVREK